MYEQLLAGPELQKTGTVPCSTGPEATCSALERVR